MRKVNKQEIISEFRLRSFGAKGWLSSKTLTCPLCGKKDKIGIYLDDKGGGVFKCFKCDNKGSIFNFLLKSNRRDLILSDDQQVTSLQSRLDDLLEITQSKEEDCDCQEISPPLGFRRIYEDSYLEKRGWGKNEFKKIEVGTSIDPRLKGKLTFLLREEGKVIGYLSRSKLPKEWHKKNLEDSKKGLCSLILRYDNSKETLFERVVGGIDEVIEGETNVVILVEGLMDKVNTDKVLKLDVENDVKCCFTCGAKLSNVQALKLLKKGVETIILMYDSETIQQTKSAALLLSKYFYDKIVEIKGNKDPGEMNADDFLQAFESIYTTHEYFLQKVPIIKLN